MLYLKRMISKAVQLLEQVMWIPIILSSWFLIERAEGPGTQQCAFMLLCLHTHVCIHFPHSTRPYFVFSHSCTHTCGISTCLSMVPRHTFSQFSTTPLGLTFTCASAASSRWSAKQAIRAKVVPHSLMHSTPGLSHAFIPRALPLQDNLLRKSGTIT